MVSAYVSQGAIAMAISRDGSRVVTGRDRILCDSDAESDLKGLIVISHSRPSNTKPNRPSLPTPPSEMRYRYRREEFCEGRDGVQHGNSSREKGFIVQA